MDPRAAPLLGVSLVEFRLLTYPPLEPFPQSRFPSKIWSENGSRMGNWSKGRVLEHKKKGKKVHPMILLRFY